MSDRLDKRADALAAQIGQGFGTKGHTMEVQARKAGRALPARVRRDIDRLADARAVKDHPKLSRQLDDRELEAAYRNASGWLSTVDRTARRKAVALGVITEIAFRILIVLAAFLAILVWRDLI